MSFEVIQEQSWQEVVIVADHLAQLAQEVLLEGLFAAVFVGQKDADCFVWVFFQDGRKQAQIFGGEAVVSEGGAQ